MADIDHIHNETKMMKVRPHCEMLSKQFLLATQKPNHPNKVDLSAPPPRRQMKALDYKSKLKLIHTRSVREALNAMEPDKALNSPPPPSSLYMNMRRDSPEPHCPSCAQATATF
ncbi:MAG: hypothetical protein GY696_27660 [Gammaproteobacteria bacterium]|nr:hypothetical protein [Gammaproteobacteria bacterium]